MNISCPTLLLDEQKCKANIKRMLDRSKSLNVKLIPHFKTHQSTTIGRWITDLGIDAITVSSLKMAEYFAINGWRDITVAFPVNVLEIDRINRIVDLGVNLTLLIVSSESVLELDEKIVGSANILIEMDAGYNRTGIPVENIDLIKSIVSAINSSENLSFYGLYCHTGNTYHADSVEEIKSIWADAISKLVAVKTELIETNPSLILRMGDTPGCTVVEDMNGIDEIGPGNFVFNDLVMNYLGVCSEDQIAVVMACPVVAKNAERNEIVIHGGGVHFSKDHLFDVDEHKFFGEVVILNENGWSPIIEGIKLTALSQEHGILTAVPDVFDTIEVGDVIGVLPIHSCLTANLMKSYLTLNGQEIKHLEKEF
jgi:D-serine deaminase-like pyridoxal phosphate-dependent protein